ncbi:hypothetical protein ACOME3_007747 [Neoechinorhynchus agilis]
MMSEKRTGRHLYRIYINLDREWEDHTNKLKNTCIVKDAKLINQQQAIIYESNDHNGTANQFQIQAISKSEDEDVRTNDLLTSKTILDSNNYLFRTKKFDRFMSAELNGLNIAEVPGIGPKSSCFPTEVIRNAEDLVQFYEGHEFSNWKPFACYLIRHFGMPKYSACQCAVAIQKRSEAESDRR